MELLTATTTDSNPPRHAVESDDEDEFNPLPRDDNSTDTDIRFIGDVNAQPTLILATGDPGAFWAKGADLGEQIGAVVVNNVQIGLVFNPSWAKANVIVSEAHSRLPVWTMHPYAQVILDTLKPTTIALLDEYSVPSYISSTPISLPDAPIRYLSTTTFDSKNEALPFAPPNLINNTSASFLSIASIADTSGTMLLLPSPNIMKPAPRSLEPNNLTHLNQDLIGWPARIMLVAHELLLLIVGASTTGPWQPADGLLPSSSRSVTRHSEVGEGAMYI